MPFLCKMWTMLNYKRTFSTSVIFTLQQQFWRAITIFVMASSRTNVREYWLRGRCMVDKPPALFSLIREVRGFNPLYTFNRDCYFTSDPGGFLAGTTKSETEAKKIMGWPQRLIYCVLLFLMAPGTKERRGLVDWKSQRAEIGSFPFQH